MTKAGLSTQTVLDKAKDAQSVVANDLKQAFANQKLDQISTVR